MHIRILKYLESPAGKKYVQFSLNHCIIFAIYSNIDPFFFFLILGTSIKIYQTPVFKNPIIFENTWVLGYVFKSLA